MTDLEHAKTLFASGKFTCVLCKGDIVYTSSKTGIVPLLEWLKVLGGWQGFSAADKIIGKAGALLFALGGIQAVYSPVMSETAVTVFSNYVISAEYSTVVAEITNRQGDGPCPLEQAVHLIDSPIQALPILYDALAGLENGKINTS